MSQGRSHQIFMGGLLAGVLALTAGCPLVPPPPPDPDPGSAVLVVEDGTIEADLLFDESHEDPAWIAEIDFRVRNDGTAADTARPEFTLGEVDDPDWSFAFDGCGEPLGPDDDCIGELFASTSNLFPEDLNTTLTVSGGEGTTGTTVEVHLRAPAPSPMLVFVDESGHGLRGDLARTDTEGELRADIPFVVENAGADDTESPTFEIGPVEGYTFDVESSCHAPLAMGAQCSGVLHATTTFEFGAEQITTTITAVGAESAFPTRTMGVVLSGKPELSFDTNHVEVTLQESSGPGAPLLEAHVPLTLTNTGTAPLLGRPFFEVDPAPPANWAISVPFEWCREPLGVGESCDLELVVVVPEEFAGSGLTRTLHASLLGITDAVTVVISTP